MRSCELRSLSFGAVDEKSTEPVQCFESNQDGIWFSFARSKQRGTVEMTTIVVPRLPKNPESCPCRVIEEYLELLIKDFEMPLAEIDGPFFKSTHGKKGKKILKTPLGKNSIGDVGIEWATELLLPNPSKYTGHCWRRTCSTVSSNSGVNVTSLMSHMGWTSPKTAIRYVQKSRQSSYSMSMYLVQAQRAGLSSEQLFSPSLKTKIEACSSHQLSSSDSEKNILSLCQKDSLIAVPSNHLAAVEEDVGVTYKVTQLKEPCALNDVSVHSVVTAVGDGRDVSTEAVEAEPGSVQVEDTLSVRQAQLTEKEICRTIGSVIGSFCNNGTVNFTINYVTK